MVYSSTNVSLEKIDGVIQGSRTSQPPRFTPRTLSEPYANLVDRLFRSTGNLLGAAPASDANMAAAPTAAASTARIDGMSRVRLVFSSKTIAVCNESYDDDEHESTMQGETEDDASKRSTLEILWTQWMRTENAQRPCPCSCFSDLWYL